MYLIVCSVAYLEFQLRRNAGEFFQYIGDAKRPVAAEIEGFSHETLLDEILGKHDVGIHNVVNIDVIALERPVAADIEHCSPQYATKGIGNEPAPDNISWAV